MKKGVIFTDLDGTLIFHDDIHNLKKIRKKSTDTIIVKDLKLNKNYECYDVSTNLYKVFFEVETRKLLYELKNKYYIVIVTGARKSSILNRRPLLNFADAFLIDNGGLILDKNYRKDKFWEQRLEKENDVLIKFTRNLESEGWNIDNKGRHGAIRIRKVDNPQKTKKDFLDLEKRKLPRELRRTSNLGAMDIILKSSGKNNAVKYYLNKIRLKKKNSIGIGDDINDIEMLKETNQKYVLGNAYAPMKKHAKEHDWRISKKKNFEGIHEILRSLF